MKWLYIVYRILSKEEKHLHDGQQCSCIIQNISLGNSWHILFFLTQSVFNSRDHLLDYCLLSMCEGITSTRSDFVNNSASQSAAASSCRFAEKSELFHRTSVYQKSFGLPLRHQLPSFVMMPLRFHK